MRCTIMQVKEDNLILQYNKKGEGGRRNNLSTMEKVKDRETQMEWHLNIRQLHELHGSLGYGKQKKKWRLIYWIQQALSTNLNISCLVRFKDHKNALHSHQMYLQRQGTNDALLQNKHPNFMKVNKC